jgi:hypothetical protein
MKFILAFVLMVSLSATTYSQSKISANSQRKELLVSMPYLSDKNAIIIDKGLQQLPGIISIQVCYELKVMIVAFDANVQNEENIIINMRSQEINSPVEQLHSSDIQKIKSTYEINTIR